uniref:Uncharacterized protein n=1 Tax=Gorilla gorilla gorilla TaxID=9595 RepID=A0A2I2YNU4_GORGO
MRPSVWAAVAAGLWVMSLPALALPLTAAPDAGGGQGAEEPLSGRGAELEVAQLLRPPQEGSSAAIVLRSAPPRGQEHRGRPGSAQWPAPLGAPSQRQPDPGAPGSRGETWRPA